MTVGPDGQPQEVRLPYRPTEVGQFRYLIEVEPPEGGAAGRTDRRWPAPIQVRKEKIRVLLAQAYPSFEYRYLRNMLARDETIELHTVLQDADVEYAEQDKAALRVFPVRRDELFAYDVVILGDVNPALLSPASAAEPGRFRGSAGQGRGAGAGGRAEVHAAAYRNTPLARLLPFDLASRPLPRSRQAAHRGLRRAADGAGAGQPGHAIGRHARGVADALAEPAAACTGWSRSRELKPAARVLAEHPARSGPDGRHCR